MTSTCQNCKREFEGSSSSETFSTEQMMQLRSMLSTLLKEEGSTKLSTNFASICLEEIQDAKVRLDTMYELLWNLPGVTKIVSARNTLEMIRARVFMAESLLQSFLSGQQTQGTESSLSSTCLAGDLKQSDGTSE